MAAAGLGILSIPPAILLDTDWNELALHIQSILCVSLALFAIVAIAYHTNPTEASFRQYLTEQSFRRHLSRIDDDFADDSDGHGITIGALNRTRDRLPAPSVKAHTALDTSPSTRLHFHGHASISLRTPPHFVRSFGVLTIAAVTPADAHPSLANATKHLQLPRQAARLPSSSSTSVGSPVVRASWFVGIFGRWWPGGTFPFDSLMFTRDEDDMRTGVLAMRAVKQPAHLDGLPLKQAVPPGSALRERSAGAHHKQTLHQSPLPRSSSPPPLPKSASLPLHDTKRGPGAKRFPADLRQKLPTVVEPSKLSHAPVPVLLSPTHQSSSSESSVALKDLTLELSASQAQISESRAKLSSIETSGAESKAALQRELEAQREQKRRDDVTRTELKQRTKALEDSKRHTDSTKREAEKRLRTATAARDGSIARIDRLQRELTGLRTGMVQDRERRERSETETAAALHEIAQQSQRYQVEIGVAEELIATLTARARDLEDAIAPETDKNAKLVAEVDAKHQDKLAFLDEDQPVLHDSPKALQRDVPSWPPPPSAQHTPADPPTLTILRRPPVTSTDHVVTPPRTSDDTDTRPGAPGRITRANSLNKKSFPGTGGGSARSGLLPLNGDTISVSKGYSIFDNDIASLPSTATTTTFAPFDSASNDFVVRERRDDRSSTSVVPSSLFNPLDSPIADARTDVSNNKPSSILAKDTRDAWQALSGNLSRSRTYPADRANVNGAMAEQPDFAVFGGSSMLPRGTAQDATPSAGHVRPSRTGLNPDAKVFNPIQSSRAVARPSSLFGVAGQQPSSTASSRLPSPNVPYSAPAVSANSEELGSGSFFSSLRAFAPSPAEREALSRALGPLSFSGSIVAPAPPPPPAATTSKWIGGLPTPATYTSDLLENSVPVSAPAAPSAYFPPLWAPPPQSSKVRLTGVPLTRAPSDGSSGAAKQS